MTPSAAALALLMTAPAAAGAPLELADAWSQPIQRTGQVGAAATAVGSAVAVGVTPVLFTCRSMDCSEQLAVVVGGWIFGGGLAATGLVTAQAAATAQAARVRRADPRLSTFHADAGWTQMLGGTLALFAFAALPDPSNPPATVLALGSGTLLVTSPAWFVLQAGDNRRAIRAATLAPETRSPRPKA